MERSKFGRKIGYARVSTIGQTLDTQLKTLKQFGCAPIFREKASGADAQRTQLVKLLSTLKKDDTVVVTRIDRLARSTFDLFAIIQAITQKKHSFTLWQNRGLIPQPAPAV